MSKITNKISEIGNYFQSFKDGQVPALFFDMVEKLIPLSSPFIKEKRYNCKATKARLFRSILYAFATGKPNMLSISESNLGPISNVHKSSLYECLRDDNVDWRGLLRSSIKIFNKQTYKELKRKHDDFDVYDPTVSFGRKMPEMVIFDDSVYQKSNPFSELLGKVFDHNENRNVVGYKGLNMAYFDGCSTYVLDFALVGEMMDKMQGLRQKDFERRYSREHATDSHIAMRMEEYEKAKPDLVIEMMTRALDYKLTPKYALFDSWFFSEKLFNELSSKNIHFLGMVKSNITFSFGQGVYNSDEIGKLLMKREGQRSRGKNRNTTDSKNQKKIVRKIRGSRFYCAETLVNYHGKKALLSLYSVDKKQWTGIITSDLSLTAEEVFKYYTVRWSIEVVHSDSKELLNLGKCQQRDFAAQIADMTLKFLVYNIMTFLKRITVYETLGGLFGEMRERAGEITLADKIWGVLMEAINSIGNKIGKSSNEILQWVVEGSKRLFCLREIIKAIGKPHLAQLCTLET